MVKKIALEEHFLCPASKTTGSRRSADVDPAILEQVVARLTDFGEHAARSRWTAPASPAPCSGWPDRACRPSATPRPPIRNARAANDFLAREIQKRPDRYSGFAHLPMQDAKAAADELERCVSELKFCGAMINGHTNGQYLDHPSLSSVLGARRGAGRADLHPSDRPGRAAPVLTAIRGCAAPPGNGASRPARTRCGWCSAALFDRFPQAQLGLGHWARPCRSCCGASTAAPGRILRREARKSRRRTTSRRTSR